MQLSHKSYILSFSFVWGRSSFGELFNKPETSIARPMATRGHNNLSYLTSLVPGDSREAECLTGVGK